MRCLHEVLMPHQADFESDPFAVDGALWSFTFFFINRRLKRLLFLSCRATRVESDGDDDDWTHADDTTYLSHVDVGLISHDS